jgi:hypothetical protein
MSAFIDPTTGQRRRYPWPARLEKAGDYELVPVGDGTAILMSGMEIAAGVKPADVLRRPWSAGRQET